VALENYATCLAGSCLITTGLIYSYAAYRGEAGDGGRAKRNSEKARQQQRSQGKDAPSIETKIREAVSHALTFNPGTFMLRIINEDMLSVYFWIIFFVAINMIMFFYTLNDWVKLIDVSHDKLKDGTLDIFCDLLECKVNRKIVRYGPISYYGALAKAAGGCLNLDCALLLLPVIRSVIRSVNNAGSSSTNKNFEASTSEGSSLGQPSFWKFISKPVTRFIPIQKNIDFHK
jgi:hypothetical protein